MVLVAVAAPLTYAGWDSGRGSASASVTQLAWRSSSSSSAVAYHEKQLGCNKQEVYRYERRNLMKMFDCNYQQNICSRSCLCLLLENTKQKSGVSSTDRYGGSACTKHC